jgi:hypothetical protein
VSRYPDFPSGRQLLIISKLNEWRLSDREQSRLNGGLWVVAAIGQGGRLRPSSDIPVGNSHPRKRTSVHHDDAISAIPDPEGKRFASHQREGGLTGTHRMSGVDGTYKTLCKDNES